MATAGGSAKGFVLGSTSGDFGDSAAAGPGAKRRSLGAELLLCSCGACTRHQLASQKLHFFLQFCICKAVMTAKIAQDARGA